MMGYRIEWDGAPQRDLEVELRADLEGVVGDDVSGLITPTLTGSSLRK